MNFRKNNKENQKRLKKPKYNMFQNTCYFIMLAWKGEEKKVPILCLLAAGFTVINNLINLYIPPVILGIVEQRQSISRLLITILCFTAVIIFCSAVLAYINTNTLYGRITVRMILVNKLNKKAAITSYPNVNNQECIRLLAKSNDCVSSNLAAGEAIWNTLTLLLQNSIGFLIYVFLLSSVDLFMIAVILATTIIGYFVSKYVNSYEYRHRDEIAEYENKIFYIKERAKDYSAAKDIRIFGIRSWLEELYNKAMDSYISFWRKAESIYIWARITDLLLAFLRNGIAYLYLISLVLKNVLTASEFLLYFTAVNGFTTWVSGIIDNLITLHRQSLDISTMREYLEYPEPFRFEEGEPLSCHKHKNCEIRFENVSFRYPEADHDTLSNINLTLHSGEKLAVVGLNGAGKTTFVKLLCGLLEPTEGQILLDGRDIREYNRRDYYCMFSAVFQNFSLLPASIAVNIAQSETEIDISRVKECAKKAGICSKIESLPKKYETLLNREVFEDAVMLSGGETQRLMLARALYKDAPVIVLDEPTAALDSIAEADIYEKYSEMTQGKMSVYISHRLASTRFCDRIILIEDAKIMETGTHKELLELEGRYAELFMVQSKYYQKGGDDNEEREENDFMEQGI